MKDSGRSPTSNSMFLSVKAECITEFASLLKYLGNLSCLLSYGVSSNENLKSFRYQQLNEEQIIVLWFTRKFTVMVPHSQRKPFTVLQVSEANGKVRSRFNCVSQ